MNPSNQPTKQSGGLSLSLDDIYYILFRQKRKIAFCTILGLVSAAVFYKYYASEAYSSHAQVYLRWVQESTNPIVNSDAVRTVEQTSKRGSTIMQNEIAILTSLDLSVTVAKSMGPENIVPPSSDGIPPSIEAASSIVNSGLVISQAGNSILDIEFQNSNPSLVQPLLNEFINRYFDTHISIHRASGKFDPFLSQQSAKFKTKLAETQKLLKQAKEDAKVISFEDAKDTYANQAKSIDSEILVTQRELAEVTSALDALPSVETIIEETVVTTTPAQDENEYNRLRVRIPILQKREQELMLQFTHTNPLLASIQNEIVKCQNRVAELEEIYPHLNIDPITGNTPQSPRNNLELTALTLEARLDVLAEQKERMRAAFSEIESKEFEIQDLLKRKELEENSYLQFSQRLAESRMEETIGSGGVNNFTIIQKPTPPVKVISTTMQITAGIAGGGLILGLAWAFLIELFLDNSIRRSKDVESKLGIPLFLSIPNARHRSFRKIANSKDKKHLQLRAASESKRPKKKNDYNPSSPTLIAAAKSKPDEYDPSQSPPKHDRKLEFYKETQELKPYYEALRDRVIGYFESRNMTHSPKLIGLTGVGNSPGTTTVAAGLSTCLSETGEGKVLLIDMTLGQESAQQFYKGKETCDLEQALELKEHAQQNDNLYVVGEGSNGYKVPNILPNRLNKIVPKLKASDFDYIIFDMPEVNSISPTPRLAGFMDTMLMVIESEKSDSTTAARATELLRKSNANLGAVLNKTRTYIPKTLMSDM